MERILRTTAALLGLAVLSVTPAAWAPTVPPERAEMASGTTVARWAATVSRFSISAASHIA